MWGRLCLGVSLTETPLGQRHLLDRDPPGQRLPRQRPPGQRPLLDRDPLDRDPLDRDSPRQRLPDRDPSGQRPPWQTPPVMWSVVHAGTESPPCGQNSWHMLVKTLPCRNFIADGNVTVLTSTVIYSAIFLCQFSFGTHETSIRQLLWGFWSLAVKVTAYYITSAFNLVSRQQWKFPPGIWHALSCSSGWLELAQTRSI